VRFVYLLENESFGTRTEMSCDVKNSQRVINWYYFCWKTLRSRWGASQISARTWRSHKYNVIDMCLRGTHNRFISVDIWQSLVMRS